MFKKVINKIKRVGAALLLSALVITNIAPVQAKAADALVPQFNFLPQDKELFRGVNLTAGQDTATDPVVGNIGNTFAGVIFYHNGVPGTVAHDVLVKVSRPNQTSNQQAVFGATISATDAVGSVSDTMTTNISDGNGLVSIVPNSVNWYPDFIQNIDPAHPEIMPASTPLLFGQSGSELFGSGLRLGDIQGCFDFAGYITFEYTVAPIPGQPLFQQSKIAQNLTTGETGTDIHANPGDEILYSLTVKNTGNGDGSYTIKDDISDILEYAQLRDVSHSGQLSGSLVNFPAAIIPAGGETVRTFKVKISNPLPTNAQDGKHFDYVMENVFGNAVYVRLPKPQSPNLSINKWVRDVTANETTFSKDDVAQAGDILEYKIEFSNTGNVAAVAVKLTDVLPPNTQYKANSTVISRNGDTEKSFDNGIAADGITINIDPGEKSYVKFQANTSAAIAANSILVNKAYLTYGAQVLPSQAQTRFLEKPVPPVAAPVKPELPKTGAGSVLLVTLFGAAGWLSKSYLAKRRVLKTLLGNF